MIWKITHHSGVYSYNIGRDIVDNANFLNFFSSIYWNVLFWSYAPYFSSPHPYPCFTPQKNNKWSFSLQSFLFKDLWEWLSSRCAPLLGHTSLLLTPAAAAAGPHPPEVARPPPPPPPPPPVLLLLLVVVLLLEIEIFLLVTEKPNHLLNTIEIKKLFPNKTNHLVH